MDNVKDFIWGTATAAYQIEGAYDQDGKGPSIWDSFSNQDGNILNNDNGNTACDFYNLWPEDIQLLKDHDIPNFRFSMSWPRLIPDGTGAINQQGIDFYNKVIDRLIEKEITPWVTMYHWDLPQALQEKGGWANRDILKWFEEYAALLHEKFGDRIKNWMILNEPNVHAWFGSCLGFHAPGIADKKTFMAATHHQNLVIGQTAKQFKSFNPDYNVGSCYQLVPIRSVNLPQDHPTLIRADQLWNKNFTEPLFKGSYPGEFQKEISEKFGLIHNGDKELMQAPLDFVGIQHYNPIYMTENEDYHYGVFFGDLPENCQTTDYDWPIDPGGLEECLLDFRKDYGDIDLVITESGAAFFDKVVDGNCDDTRRIDYLKGAINATKSALNKGVNIKGYFVWSFLDNFEWADGYKYRFGMVHVDYENSCKRTPKCSIKWFQELINERPKCLETS